MKAIVTVNLDIKTKNICATEFKQEVAKELNKIAMQYANNTLKPFTKLIVDHDDNFVNLLIFTNKD